MAFTVGVILFALGIALSISLHEFGHLLTAKAYGMKASRYFIGFGPTLFSFRRGETEYGLKALPAGGFVKIEGMTQQEAVAPEDEARAFWRFGPWKRTVVLVAGSLTHFVLAAVALYGAALTTGLPTDRAVIGSIQPCVVTTGASDGSVRDCQPGDPVSPATAAGLRKGDRITEIGGTRIDTYEDMLTTLRAHPGETLPVTYVRGGDTKTTDLTIATARRAPLSDLDEKSDGDDGLLAVGAIGVSGSLTETYGPIGAVGAAADFTGQTVKATFTALANIPEKIPPLFDAVFGGAERDVEGPVSVVGVSRAGGQAVDAGVWVVFWLLFAGFNLFIGVFNLFPLLPMDGGHIAILWFERVRSKIAARMGKSDPGPVDYNKLMPVTMLVVVLMGGLSLLTILADIVNPINLN